MYIRKSDTLDQFFETFKHTLEGEKRIQKYFPLQVSDLKR